MDSYLRSTTAAEALSTYGNLSYRSTVVQMEAARAVAMTPRRDAEQVDLPCSDDWRFNAALALKAFPAAPPDAELDAKAPRLSRQLRRQTGRIMGRVMVSKSKTHKRKEAKLDMKSRRRLKTTKGDDHAKD